MSQDEAARAPKEVFLPGPGMVVLHNRQLRPGTDRSTLSVVGDMRWNLRPAILEDHMASVSINFALVPKRFRDIAKIYIWMELNCEEGLTILRRANINGKLAVFTMVSQLRNLRGLLDWMDVHGFTSIADVTPEDLEDYLDAVRDAELTHGYRSDLLQAVRRLWAFRELLPPEGRLPEMPPWGGKESRVLLGKSRRDRENGTPRIQEPTMTMAVLWAARFVEDFAEDIIAALDEFRPLFGFKPGRHSPGAHRRVRIPGQAGAAPEVGALIESFRASGRDLPGRQREDGIWEPDWPFLAKLLDLGLTTMQKNQAYRDMFLTSGIPVAHGTFLALRPRGLLDGEPWTKSIAYDDVKQLVRTLSTACFLLVAYLTGCRPGEALNLRRGCLRRDRVTKLWEVHGRKWKNARDENGEKIPEGQFRDEPWIAPALVATAIGVQERLHDADVLFPVWLVADERAEHEGGEARTLASINDDLNLFVTWVNSFCDRHGRSDVVPVDPRRLTSSRLRRTLAWFICRRPRGMVAAAVQYGHLRVQITQGYAGTYASGFPDDLAFERWLSRLEDLQDADRRMKAGEHVSGPAADTYRSRVSGGTRKFAGRVLRTGAEARHVMANASLQIYSGRGMTCVFTAPTARCELNPSLDDARVTPDTEGCHPACVNICRTEDNIDELRAEAAELRAVVADEASPPIRWERERRRLAQLDQLIEDHERGRIGGDAR
ncbi:hypothetical protein [Streptomyces sp. NRRL S-350]|uniref:hypothetical protein n=1 Tax=Streptomyces sp. NRRL S-350 TaxID=1463902 RepID=UPI0004C0DC04|nr:hypothetical protein [Streptomyces sp. NRRL S-350]